MAYKNYKIRDNWLDIDKFNDVDIQSVDGVIQNVKVNGEDVGGGGSSDLNNPIQLELAAEGSHLATVLTAGEIYTLCQTGTPYFTVTAEQIATYEDPYKPNTKYFINEYFYDDSEGPAVIGFRFVMLGVADTTDAPTKTVLDLLQSPADAVSHIVVAGGQ